MNYEEFYQTIQPQEKSLKDGLASLQRLFKTIGKESAGGDIKNLIKDLAAMAEVAASLSDSITEIQATAESFDSRAYFESGEFAQQLLEVCTEKNVDVRGEFPIYEMFPYRVRLDAENQDIYLDRKKLQCMRPQSLVETIKKGQEKLNKASFNPQAFASELNEAYDLAVLKLNRQPGSDIYLLNLYKFLTPMSRFRKDYDQQSFAFDLARLYIDGTNETKNGTKFQFGPAREGKRTIRILKADGQEEFLATIRFYKEDAI